MPKFIYVGKTWINVDNITMVHMEESVSGEPCCRIVFARGSGKDLSVAETRELLEFLRKNKVQD